VENMKNNDMEKNNKNNHSKGLILSIIFVILASAIIGSVAASEPVAIRVVSANPATRTYTFACLDNGSGLAGNGARNWFIYPEDTGIDELITTLPASQYLTYTFNRTAYYDITCNDPNPPGLNYTSLYRHSLHIDLRTQLGNPAVIPLSVGPGKITEKCVYNGTNYSMSWFLSSYSYTGGSGNTVRYSLNSTNDTITFTAPFAPGLFDTHCLIHFSDGRNDIDLPWGIDFPNSTNSAPYVADQYGINLADNFAPFNYNTWISLHNGNGIPINNTGNQTNNQTSNQTNNTTPSTGNLNVTTTPGGANVFLNGNTIGLTSNGNSGNLLMTNLTAGTDNISILLTGYVTYKNTVKITANNTVALSVILLQQNISNSTNSTGNSTNTTYYSMKDIPPTCTGGIITSDIYNGGRTITCASGVNNLAITVWNKPSNTAPQYFEMYKKSQAGNGQKICLLTTCISNNGYAKSPNFPIIG